MCPRNSDQRRVQSLPACGLLARLRKTPALHNVGSVPFRPNSSLHFRLGNDPLFLNVIPKGHITTYDDLPFRRNYAEVQNPKARMVAPVAKCILPSSGSLQIVVTCCFDAFVVTFPASTAVLDPNPRLVAIAEPVPVPRPRVRFIASLGQGRAQPQDIKLIEQLWRRRATKSHESGRHKDKVIRFHGLHTPPTLRGISMPSGTPPLFSCFPGNAGSFRLAAPRGPRVQGNLARQARQYFNDGAGRRKHPQVHILQPDGLRRNSPGHRPGLWGRQTPSAIPLPS